MTDTNTKPTHTPKAGPKKVVGKGKSRKTKQYGRVGFDMTQHRRSDGSPQPDGRD